MIRSVLGRGGHPMGEDQEVDVAKILSIYTGTVSEVNVSDAH